MRLAISDTSATHRSSIEPRRDPRATPLNRTDRWAFAGHAEYRVLVDSSSQMTVRDFGWFHLCGGSVLLRLLTAATTEITTCIVH